MQELQENKVMEKMLLGKSAEKRNKGVLDKTVLIKIAVLLVTIKMIFVGSNVDEEYGIELAYRLAKGDRLLADLWEPHQTSAIFGAALTRLYWFFTGGSNTGIVLYMHLCGAALQILTAWFLYRVIRKITQNTNASFAAACIYALSYPKGVIAPEYSNLQNWFTTCTALVFLLYWENKRSIFMILSGVFLSCAILSYPSMIILYPVLVVILFLQEKKQTWKPFLLLSLPCVLIGAAMIFYLRSYCSFSEIMQNIGYILGDGSHSASLVEKLGKIGYYAGLASLRVLLYLIGAGILTFVLNRWKKRNWTKYEFCLAALWISMIISIVMQIAIWIFGKIFVNQPQTEMILMTMAGILILVKRGKKIENNRSILYLLLISLTGFAATLILSNFKFTELIVYLCLGALSGMLLLVSETARTDLWHGIGWDSERISRAIITFWILSLLFGRVWVASQGGELHSSLLDIRNVQKSGPGIGIFTNYMTGYRYNKIAGEWKQLISDGEPVLYVGPTSFYYMLGDVVISAPNTISTPIYDSSLLEYWKIHPDRYPRAVLVESCYGELSYPDNSWIVQWLNTQYHAGTVKDYEYFRLYQK